MTIPIRILNISSSNKKKRRRRRFPFFLNFKLTLLIVLTDGLGVAHNWLPHSVINFNSLFLKGGFNPRGSPKYITEARGDSRLEFGI